jgi:hypothetical protein
MKPLARGSRPFEPNLSSSGARKAKRLADSDESWAAAESSGSPSVASKPRDQELYVDSPETCQVAVGPQSEPELGCLTSASSRLLDALCPRRFPMMPIFMTSNPAIGGVQIVPPNPPYRSLPPSKRRVVWVWVCVSGFRRCGVASEGGEGATPKNVCQCISHHGHVC